MTLTAVHILSWINTQTIISDYLLITLNVYWCWRLISLEHDLSSEMGLFSGVIAHAHLQHPLGFHPPHVLHVLLLLAHKAFTCKKRHSLHSQWCRNKVNYHQTKIRKSRATQQNQMLDKSLPGPSLKYLLGRSWQFWLCKPNLPKSPAHPSALYCLRTRPTAFWLWAGTNALWTPNLCL